MDKLLVFPREAEFENAKKCMEALGLHYSVIAPPQVYKNTDVPAIVLAEEAFSSLSGKVDKDFVCSGWIDYRPHPHDEPEQADGTDAADVFGCASIMTIAPCIADDTKVRTVVYLANGIAHTFPYINTIMPSANYVRDEQTLTYMMQHRLITLYNNKVAIAKADNIVDVWATIRKIAKTVNHANASKGSITPSCERRKKPSAVEIYSRLPKTNCGECGQKACMAFGLSLWNGQAQPSMCRPIFEGAYTHLMEPYIRICAGLGLTAPEK